MSRTARFLDRALQESLERLPVEDRRTVVEKHFGLAQANGIRTTAELRRVLLNEFPRRLLGRAAGLLSRDRDEKGPGDPDPGA